MAYDLNDLRHNSLPELEGKIANGAALDANELSLLCLNLIERMNQLAGMVPGLLAASEMNTSLIEAHSKQLAEHDKILRILASISISQGLALGDKNLLTVLAEHGIKVPS